MAWTKTLSTCKIRQSPVVIKAGQVSFLGSCWVRVSQGNPRSLPPFGKCLPTTSQQGCCPFSLLLLFKERKRLALLGHQCRHRQTSNRDGQYQRQEILVTTSMISLVHGPKVGQHLIKPRRDEGQIWPGWGLNSESKESQGILWDRLNNFTSSMPSRSFFTHVLMWKGLSTPQTRVTSM